MDCPACKNPLQELKIGDVILDVCKGGCGGVWFDAFEFRKFDEPHEYKGGEHLEIPIDNTLVLDRSKRLSCPKCDNVVMMRHFFSVKKEVELDECPACGGFWLDAEELSKIHSLFSSEQERREAAEQHFSDVFDKEFSAIKAENEMTAKKAAKISNMFRFICPSYYIRGKQDWGAF